jgi:HPr kinase/phosphorylase
MLVHATCVAMRTGGRWRAVLLRGPSGAGKSDLALRLIEAGARLVSDDQTVLESKGRAVIATAPASIRGLIEVRGVGIVRLARQQLIAEAPLALVADLVPGDRVERLPEAALEDMLGMKLPLLSLAPFEASAPVKLRLALVQGSKASSAGRRHAR